MRDLAKISRIQNIEAIEGKDRIELATVENYPVIVGKDEYKVGDLVTYISYDVVLPMRPEFEFLRARCWSKLYQGFRIRNMSMAGVYSSGIVFPLSILPKGTKIVEGLDVSEILGVVKYDPEAMKEVQVLKEQKHGALFHYLCRFRWFRYFAIGKKRTAVVPYPSTVKKSDEENIEKMFNHLQAQHPVARWVCTEKMEGQSGTWMLYGKRRKYLVYSRNTARNPNGDGNWERLGRALDLEKILRSESTNYAIQGEICGPGIQRNIYGFPEHRLFVFKITNTDNGYVLPHKDMVAFCARHNLQTVPVLAEDIPLPQTLKKILDDCQGNSVFKHQTTGKKVMREGVVWKSVTDSTLSFKAKSRTYAAWFESKNETE